MGEDERSGSRHGPPFRPGPGFRPPWWPENEPFPPVRAEWSGWRRRFLRRIGLFVALLFALMFLANALAVGLLSGQVGNEHHRGFIPALAILAAGLLVAFVSAGRAVRRMARPVGDLMEAADRVSAGDYTARVDERGPRELRRLARSFNDMTGRLQASEGQRRSLFADVAHELRTPLSVIQGNVEGMLDGLYAPDREHLEPVLEETKVMSRLLEDLQTLSMAEAGALRLHREQVEPASLVAETTSAFASRAKELGVRLEHRADPGVRPIEADPVRIGEVLSNLLQNALRHTPPGGSVIVAVEPGDGGRVAFSVMDTGPGIPPDVLPHVFDRFVKGGDSRGAGLGLAIAKGLVEAHGGQISATSDPGRGTAMRFLLPAYA
jgi:signal transduction histidine kinase